MNRAESYIQSRLFALQDKSYRDFQAKLIPTIPYDSLIGVRIPEIRKLAKDLSKNQPQMTEEFLHSLPHSYYDENNLHSFLIANIKDYETCITAVNEFLPYINNWATCDTSAPKVFQTHQTELLQEIQIWLHSSEIYTIRFGIGMLMRLYLDEAFLPEYLDWVADIHSEEYYVNMMIAWYFATALAKQYHFALPYLENKKLNPWVHQKTIQKAVESYRITAEQKIYLKSLRLK